MTTVAPRPKTCTLDISWQNLPALPLQCRTALLRRISSKQRTHMSQHHSCSHGGHSYGRNGLAHRYELDARKAAQHEHQSDWQSSLVRFCKPVQPAKPMPNQHPRTCLKPSNTHPTIHWSTCSCLGTAQCATGAQRLSQDDQDNP